MEYSSLSSSESDSTLVEKLNRGDRRKTKFRKPTLKRNPREGMCLLSGDEKPAQEEMNLIEIESDKELDNVPIEILSTSSTNLVSLDDDDNELESSMLEIDFETVAHGSPNIALT